MYICGSYIWGINSPVYNCVNVDLLNILENDINMYSNIGSVYIVGDLNSRIGLNNDFIIHDTINLCTDDIDYDPDCTHTRASSDYTHNSHGLRLYDLCKATGIRIVNGPFSNSHQHTYLSPAGCSVIDYLLTDPESFKHLSSFKIGSFCE